MKNFVVALLIVIITVVESKPIEEINEGHAQTDPDNITAANGHHFGDKLSLQDQTTPRDATNQLHHDETNPQDQISRSKRQFPDDDQIVLNKQFFDNIFQATRISRDTSVPTIALLDLVNSVEQTLIHSAQNLAASNLTSNSTTNTGTNDNSVVNTPHTSIVLPITIPTPEPKSTTEFVTEYVEITTTATEENLNRQLRSKDEDISEPKTDFESVKLIDTSNIGILSPISLNLSDTTSEEEEEEHTDIPVTEQSNHVDQSNVTIIQTINSTQLIPTDSDAVHLHQQHITIFSANAGVFPNIHAVKAEDLPALAQKVSTTSEQPELEDCGEEETSDESSDDHSSTSEEKSASNSSSEETDDAKKIPCTRKSPSVATTKSTTVESTTKSIEVIKKTKTEELQEKIAEVEADPVILTQGI